VPSLFSLFSLFYHNMLDDIGVHTAKTTHTAAGITADLLKGMFEGGIHRQEHGTGQGTTGMVLKTRHRASRLRLSLARIVQIRDTASI
jgi:hypothetical protein